LLGRYLFRDCVTKAARDYPVFEAIDHALEGENGFKIMFLLRLSPLIPYNALDYISGVTTVPLWCYCLALLGILPGVVFVTFLGATASSLSSHDSKAEKIGLVFGVITTFIGVFVAWYYSKKELDKILARRNAGEEQYMLEDADGSAPLGTTHELT